MEIVIQAHNELLVFIGLLLLVIGGLSILVILSVKLEYYYYNLTDFINSYNTNAKIVIVKWFCESNSIDRSTFYRVMAK